MARNFNCPSVLKRKSVAFSGVLGVSLPLWFYTHNKTMSNTMGSPRRWLTEPTVAHDGNIPVMANSSTAPSAYRDPPSDLYPSEVKD